MGQPDSKRPKQTTSKRGQVEDQKRDLSGHSAGDSATVGRGGKRAGAGRPKVADRPMPVSWRPDTQAQRDKWLELGGARWVKRLLSEALVKPDKSQ